jgi:hypothetical protein
MFNTIVGAGAVGAGAALRYGSDGRIRLRPKDAALAPQHWLRLQDSVEKFGAGFSSSSEQFQYRARYIGISAKICHAFVIFPPVLGIQIRIWSDPDLFVGS